MKQAFSLLVFLVFSSVAIAAETITVSGKVTHTTDNKIAIRGESFLKEISLKPDGSFSETFPISYVGTYTLTTADNRMSLYLTKNTKLSLTVDNANFYQTMVYTGKGSAENQYIVRKTAITLPIKQEEIYKLGEAEFLARLNEIKSAMLKNFETTKFDDADFAKKEKQNIFFFEQLYLLNYPSYHAHYAKIQGFKPADTFPKPDPLINVDDNEAFLFSNSYKQFVNEKFSQYLDSKMTPLDQYMAVYALPEIKKIKSESIRNAYVQTLSYEISAGNPNSAELYKELMALSSNPYFKKELAEKYEKTQKLAAGVPSPQFDYENHNGGKTSLASLKGSYVYIDVWATWCGPCRQEIPSLQKVEEQFKDKNIKFVSISIDAKKDHEKWSKMVTDKQLGGIQLFADNDWNSQFVKDYAIDGIPRFIIIAPDGTIFNADAPRPSDPKLVDLLNGFKI